MLGTARSLGSEDLARVQRSGFAGRAWQILPSWARTARARLTLTYTLLLFGISSVLLLGVYLALSRTLVAAPPDPVTVKKFRWRSDGTIVYSTGESFQAADLTRLQEYVNYQALESLRSYSTVALVIMFILSLLIGWWVAGRILRPIGFITETTRAITATDLSRRIRAKGPADELRTLADTIDSMLDRLDKAFRAERRLVEDVSHELRNPVAVVQANVEAVLADERATVEERRHAVGVVSRATTRMHRLLEDLLTAARLRSLAFAESPVDLAGLTHEVGEEYRVLAQDNGLTLEFRLASGPQVYADPEALSRAVGNLLSNAVGLAPAGSTVTVATGNRQGWAWVAIQDEGPGIAPEDQEAVFDRFHRGSQPEAVRRRRGSGLGLAIARQIVESHDGRLVVFSKPGLGSTFVIWLPDRALRELGAEPDHGRGDQPPEGSPLRV
jgi:signal transduction histidine kinase